MKATKITQYFFLAGAMVSTSALAVPTLFEDFSDTLSMDKYWAMEETTASSSDDDASGGSGGAFNAATLLALIGLLGLALQRRRAGSDA